ncbi:MAG: hypothetical protein ACFFCW_38090, partial [Candidatus Hodarchaeota archaeon]
TEEFEPDAVVANPDFTQITADVYAIVYRGADYDGFIKTLRIEIWESTEAPLFFDAAMILPVTLLAGAIVIRHRRRAHIPNY